MANLPPLPEGWEERRDEQGHTYYVDHNTRSSSWRDPRLIQTGSPPPPAATAAAAAGAMAPSTMAPTNNGGGGSNSFFNRSSANRKPAVGMSESMSSLESRKQNGAAAGPDSPRRRRSMPVPRSGGGGGGGKGLAESVDKSREDVTFSPHLIPDDDRSQCSVCGERFAALRRRHHCRCCGEVVCAACSPTKLLIHVSEPGYERPRRACQTCAAHIAAGEYSCNARYALAIATPGADMYHKQAAVRHLSAAMEDAAKKAVQSGGSGGGGDGGGGGVLGPLSAIQRVHGGTPAVFEALVPMMSTEVPLDVCAHACQLLGASLFVASRQSSPETWVGLVKVIPEGGMDGLLECLRVAPARAKAARALFYAAKVPLAGGTGGELIESRGGVSIMLEVLESLPLAPPPTAAVETKGLRVWLCATLQPVMADRPRAVQAFLACRGIPLLCRQLVAGPSDIAVHVCGVLASALRSGGGGGGAGSSAAVPRSAIEAVDASIIDPLLGMLAGGTNKDAHASALAMELLVVLASHPPFSGRLRAAGTIPAVAACLEDHPARGTAAAEPVTRASLMQLALIVLTGFLRSDGDQPAAAKVDEIAAEIAATRAHVRVVALLSAPDPKLRFTAAELALQLSRRCRSGPAPNSNRSGGGGGGGIAKDMIEAGGLGALWRACSDPSPMARPVALEALAAMLGTAAAMSRSRASSEAVLALVSEGAVEGLVRQHVDPALSVLGRRGRGVAGGGSATIHGDAAAAPAAASVATSALLALHFLAANPDPAVHGLFVVAAGVDEQQGGAARSGGGSSTWSTILSSVEAGAEGRGGPAFLEAAVLAAGSVCGAPPLPVLGVGGGAVAPSGSVAADEIDGILPAYQARARTADCLLAAASATSRGLATRAVALLDAGGSSGGSTDSEALSSAKLTRAAIRVVWSLSRGPSSATLAAHGTLPRLMGRMSCLRRKGSGGGADLARGDTAAGVLVLDTIAAFLSLEDSSNGHRRGSSKGSVAPVSPATATTIGRTVDELCELVLHGTAAKRATADDAGDDGSSGAAAGLLGPRSLALLAKAASNPRLRPMLVDSPKFPDVLDLLMVERHLDGASSNNTISLEVALGALSVVEAAVSDERTASRLVKLGVVSKLAALVRQKPAGPPPPLPPRRSGSGGGASPPPHAVVAGVTAEVEAPRREEVCAGLRVLAGLAAHEACVPLVLESEDLGCLLQVIREAMTPTSAAGREASGGSGHRVRAEMREEVEDALRCLLSLTARPQQRSSLNRALGLVATSPAHPGLDALLNLASAEGGPALQVVFQLVAADAAKSVPSSPVLRPLGDGRHPAVLKGLLGPADFPWQGGIGPSARDSTVKAARARACDALRHACSELPPSSSSAPAAARGPEVPTGGGGGSGGDSVEAGPGGNVTAGGGKLDVEAVVEVFPLLFSLAWTTLEGARCLRAMFAARGGVGEAAQAAVLRGGVVGDAGGAGAGGIAAIVAMLHSKHVEIRAAGASILRKLVFASAAPTHRPEGGQAAAAAAAAAAASTRPCRALLESLHACGGRSEALRSLSSLGLFGEQDQAAVPGDTMAVIDGGGGGGRGRGERAGSRKGNAGGGRRNGTAQEARWRRQLRDDATAVLVSVVGAVTGGAGNGSGRAASWRQHRRRRSRGAEAADGLVGWSGGGEEGFDAQESEALSGVCVEALQALATDNFTGPLEKARCLSLLADLALDPRCARTLFQGGAIPQMLLNAQGCTHVDLIDVHGDRGGDGDGGGGGGFVGGSDGRASPAPSATSCDSEARSAATATENLATEREEEEEEERQHVATGVGGSVTTAGAVCCRCRQATRLLARLVRGLPGETPAVVVRHSGLRSVVQILEDGAAEAKAAARGTGRRIPAATEAAVREALELFVALSEQKPHRRALVDLPGLARSASSYIVSATTASPTSSSPRTGEDSSAEESAFRLLANLAFAEGTRRRVLELDGLVLASARALSTSALAVAPPTPKEVPAAAALAAAVGAGEAAAALLCRLSPVLGAEGGEEELVAAGEALSAAVAAAAEGDITAAATAVGLASEALYALLVLSWADSRSLDAAAAVDGFVTDSRFADSVVSLWRRGTAPSASSGFGALSETALATMSSIAARPTGRQSLVAAGAASAVVDVALGQQSGGDAAGDSEGGCSQTTMMAPHLSVSERGEIIRLLCVLCASPAHRGAVRSSLMAKRGLESGGDDTEEAAVEAAIVRIQGGRGGGGGGGGGGGEDCRAGARRLALLLGVSPPSRRSSHHRGGTTAGAGAFAAEHLSSGDHRRAPFRSPPTGDAVVKRRSTSTTTRSPSPPPPPAYAVDSRAAAAGLDDDTASSVDLEEALFPTVTATAVAHLGSPGAPGVSATPALSRAAVAVAPVASARAPAAGRRDRERWTFPPAPKNGRSDSEESLHRLLSMIANEDNSSAAVASATANGSLRGAVVGAEERDDKIACESCGKLVFAPTGFDLALIECPHCQKPMG